MWLAVLVLFGRQLSPSTLVNPRFTTCAISHPCLQNKISCKWDHNKGKNYRSGCYTPFGSSDAWEPGYPSSTNQDEQHPVYRDLAWLQSSYHTL